MGLEVIAYRALHLTSYTAYDFERMMLWDDHVYVDLSEQRGAGHVSGLVDQGVYVFGASFSFEVGMYSSFTHFKDWVCQQVNQVELRLLIESPQPHEWPLGLWLTCPPAGYMDTASCALIYAQMVANEHRLDFRTFGLGHQSIMTKWRDWKHAYQLASDGGCILFA